MISTGGMDAETIKSLRKKYFLAPLMLFYMKHCNYEKPKLIKVGMGHSRNESKEELAYAKDMFETIFKDYTKEKEMIDKLRCRNGNLEISVSKQDTFAAEL